MENRLFSVFRTSGNALAVQRRQIELSSENIANAQTTRVEGQKGPYKIKRLVQEGPRQVESFGRLMERNSLEMHTTHESHRSSNQVNNRGESVNRDLSPRATVVEQEKIRWEYDPTHPDSNENGMVAYPDVDMVEEMTNILSANRLYEANLTVIEAEKQNIRQALSI
jgi:flagellar basal-body rod protein FlgC